MPTHSSYIVIITVFQICYHVRDCITSIVVRQIATWKVHSFRVTSLTTIPKLLRIYHSYEELGLGQLNISQLWRVRVSWIYHTNISITTVWNIISHWHVTGFFELLLSAAYVCVCTPRTLGWGWDQEYILFIIYSWWN